MPAHSNFAYVNEDGFEGEGNFNSIDGEGITTSTSAMLPRYKDKRKSIKKARAAYISIAILCCINLINYMDRFTIAGVLDDVQMYYSLSNTEAGLLQTSFVISYMIMAPVFGYLGDRYNRRNIMAFGITFWSITTIAGSYIPKNYFGLFIFLRALVGTGEASYSTIAPTIIADLFSRDLRSRMLAVFYFAIPVGSGLGYIVGSQIAHAFGSWKWSLRVTPAIGILCVILLFFFLRDPPRGEAEGGTNLKTTSVCSDLADLYKTRSFVWCTLGFTCVTFATGALAWWGPKYMKLATPPHIQEKIDSNLAFGAITCFAGIVGVLIGSFSSRYLRRVTLRADPLICAVGILLSVPFCFTALVVASDHVTLPWILLFLGEISLCVNWTIVADMLLYVIIPTRRSMAEAVQILVSHALGDASSPYICGLVADSLSMCCKDSIDEHLSLQYALYIPMVVLVFGGFCFLVAAMHIERDRIKCSLVTHGITPPLCTSADKASFLQPVMLAADDVSPVSRKVYFV